MSMLRRSAMKRALRQSSGSYKDLQKETSTVAENIKTNVTDTSGLSSAANTSRTRNKRSNKKKGNSPKSTMAKEDTLPVAQSTMIEQSYDHGNQSDLMEKNERRLLNKTDNKTLNNNKELFDKISSQEAADILCEYQYKYSRLNTILEQFKNEQAELLAVHQKQIETVKDSKAKVNNQMYSIESEKFNLEEEFQRMKKENEELRNKLTRYEKETTEVETQTEQEESTSSTPKANALDLSRISSSGKQQLSRSRRRSILSETVNSIAKDRNKKIELYKDMILDQQDIMDFYSLLAGTSIWKPHVKEQDGNDDIAKCEAGEDEEEPVEMKFPCKVQLLNDLEGYQFEMALNRNTRQVVYTPLESFKEGPYFDKLPDALKDSVSYAADDACLFVSELSKTIESPS